MINFEKENTSNIRVEEIKQERLQAVHEIVASGGPLDKYLTSQGVDPSTAAVYFRGSSQTGMSLHGRPVRELSDIDLLVYADKTDGTQWRKVVGKNKAFEHNIGGMNVSVEVIAGYAVNYFDSDLDALYSVANLEAREDKYTIKPEGVLVRGIEFVFDEK
jgi:hypothetical protein